MAYDLSIIVPVFTQGDVLRELHRQLKNTISNLNLTHNILFIADGSPPRTWETLQDIYKNDDCVTLIKLRRNYGQANAIAAGASRAIGRYVVVMDADLQDKPHDISLLWDSIISNQADMVLAKRPCCHSSLWRKLASVSFFRLSALLTTVNQPANTGVFRIIRQELLETLLSHPSQPGTLLSRLQFLSAKVETIETTRNTDIGSKSSYNISKLICLGLERFLVYPRFRIPLINYTKLSQSFIPHYEIEKEYPARLYD